MNSECGGGARTTLLRTHCVRLPVTLTLSQALVDFVLQFQKKFHPKHNQQNETMRLLVLLLYLIECHSFKSSLKEPRYQNNSTESWRPLSASEVSAIHSVQSPNRRNEFYWTYDPRHKRQQSQLAALKGFDQQIEVPLEAVEDDQQEEHNLFVVIEEDELRKTTTEDELQSRKELLADSGSKIQVQIVGGRFFEILT